MITFAADGTVTYRPQPPASTMRTGSHVDGAEPSVKLVALME